VGSLIELVDAAAVLATTDMLEAVVAPSSKRFLLSAGRLIWLPAGDADDV
jgi:hypothetical protein